MTDSQRFPASYLDGLAIQTVCVRFSLLRLTPGQNKPVISSLGKKKCPIDYFRVQGDISPDSPNLLLTTMKENLPSDNLKPSNCSAFLSISQSTNPRSLTSHHAD